MMSFMAAWRKRLRAWRKPSWLARDEFPYSRIAPAVRFSLAGLFLALLLARAMLPDPSRDAQNLPPPPSYETLDVAAGGERATMARLTALRLQSYDAQSGKYLKIASLHTPNLIAWLERSARLDPSRHYPYMLAAMVYDHGDAQRSRALARFVTDGFVAHPDVRWQYLAQIAVRIRHAHRDPGTAREIAAILRRHAPASAPSWVRQLEIFYLEDMGELEAARQLAIGIIESGVITDPAELNYLTKNLLERIERKQRQDR